MTLTVRARWRYPVKTLAGERLDVAEITMVGDRIVHVRLLVGSVPHEPHLARDRLCRFALCCKGGPRADH